jgi:hypothetical protein
VRNGSAPFPEKDQRRLNKARMVIRGTYRRRGFNILRVIFMWRNLPKARLHALITPYYKHIRNVVFLITAYGSIL